MRRRLTDQRGDILVIGIMIVTMMLVLGAAALSTVDTQTDVVKKERQHESTFNLAEGVLNAQTFVLGRLGTGTAANQFPVSCTHEATATLCPDPDQLARTYAQAAQNDYDPDTVWWWTQVRDNPNGTLYSPAAVSAAPRYDANNDNKLWVTAFADVRDRQRTLVALIAVENRPITFPNYALVGGYVKTGNSGNNELIDATGSLGIAVRCSSPPQSTTCLDYSTKHGGQLTPPGAFQLNYSSAPAIDADSLAALEDIARAAGTYYTSCPSNPNGAVVVIDFAGPCNYTTSAPSAPGMSVCCNSPSQPGLLIVKCNGSIELGGKVNFHGIVYAPNVNATTGAWCSSGIVVATQGNGMITGGVLVDGPGGIKVCCSGGNGENLVYSPAAFSNVKVAGTAGVVQNTWREIPDDN